jgi:hypothetical protein
MNGGLALSSPLSASGAALDDTHAPLFPERNELLR